MLELAQIHAASPKTNPFRFEQKALLHRRLAAQRDPPAGTQNALPRQPSNLPQNSSYMTRASRIPGSFGNRSIGTDAASRNATNGSTDCRDEGRLWLAL